MTTHLTLVLSIQAFKMDALCQKQACNLIVDPLSRCFSSPGQAGCHGAAIILFYQTKLQEQMSIKSHCLEAQGPQNTANLLIIHHWFALPAH